MTTPTTEEPKVAAAHTGEEHAHPTEAAYIKIALILAVVTGIEVGLYYTKFSEELTNGLLLVLSAIKFAMVIMYFMHLKFDSRVLRRLFITGLVLAVFCYVAVLLSMGVFIG